MAIAMAALPASALADAPTATTEPVTITGASAALLNGDLSTGGLDTTYFFKYALASNSFCTDPTTGTPTSTQSQIIHGSTQFASVSAPVTGLTFGSTYCYLLHVTNGSGSSDGQLTTFVAGQPSADTNDVVITGATSVTINGDADPSGQSNTTVEVDYDTASSAFCTGDNPGSTDNATFKTAPVPLNSSATSFQGVSLPVTSNLTKGQQYCAEIVTRVTNNSISLVGLGAPPVTFTAGSPFAQTDTAAATGGPTATVTGSVNPSGQADTTYEAVYDVAGNNASVWCQNNGTLGSPSFHTSPQSLPVGQIDTNYHSVSVNLTGLTPGTQYCVAIEAINSSGTAVGNIITFTAGTPLATTFDAVATGASTANVDGEVNPSGQSTTVKAEWGPSTTGDHTWCDTGGNSGTPAGTATLASSSFTFTDSTFHNVTVPATGLTPGTQYCARITATNASGTAAGDQVTFTAGTPIAETDSAQATSSTSATVSGQVNPSGQTTTVSASYALSTALWCTSNGAQGAPAGSANLSSFTFTDSTFHAVSVPVTGLQAGADYCARIDASNAAGSAHGGQVSFSLALKPIVSLTGATATGGSTESVSGTVNPNGSTTTAVFQYDLNNQPWCTSNGQSGTPANTTSMQSVGSGTSDQTVSANLTGLSPGATYCWALSATNGAGTSTTSTGTFLAGLPTAVTNAASALTGSGATLNGQVNPQGNVTNFHFEYDVITSQFCQSNGTTGSAANSTTATAVGFTDTSLHSVSAPLTGLTTHQTYCFRVVASSQAGSANGSILSFTPGAVGAPIATTQAADNVTQTGVTLHGTINPSGQATMYFFQYGTTDQYGSGTTPASAGSGTSDVAESATITGLVPDTLYHFRIVAQYGAGQTVDGSDMTFTTGQSVPTTFTLTVSTSGSGSGHVSGNAISCPSSCSHAYNAGTLVTLTATPAAGSSFSGWQGDCGGKGSCAVNMNSARNVIAMFTKNPPPSCTLTLPSNKVSKAKPKLTLSAKCTETASLTLTGALTDVGKKPKKGKAKTKKFNLGPVRLTDQAGKTSTISVSVPGGAVTDLRKGDKESIAFTLVFSNPNGSGRLTKTLSGLKLGR